VTYGALRRRLASGLGGADRRRLGDRVPGVVVSHITVDFRRPLGRGDDVVVACELDAIGRASFRTRETVIAGGAVAVEAATTLEVARRALTAGERAALAT
jgi:acyl-CoA thioesterase FadM